MGDIGGIAQAAGSVAAAGIQAGAITSASHTQADAAKYAAGLQSDAANKSLAFQQSAFDKTQANQAPWLQAGQGALSALQAGTKNGGSLVQAYPGGQYTPGQYNAPAAFTPDTYNAPAAFTPDTFSFNPSDLENTPGYQFQLNQGMSALQKSQAAQGISNSGGAQKAITNYAQGLAGTTYNQERNAALQAFQTNEADKFGAYTTNSANALNAFNVNEGNKAGAYNTNANNAFNAFNVNEANKAGAYNTNLNEFNVAQSKQLNALQSLAGLGQNATNQVNSSAASFANNAAATLQNGAANAANYTTQGANASAAGAVGLGNTFAGLSQGLGGLAAYQSLYGSSYGGGNQGGGYAASDNSSLPVASLPSGTYNLGQYLG